jgi:hypothetical protein
VSVSLSRTPSSRRYVDREGELRPPRPPRVWTFDPATTTAAWTKFDAAVKETQEKRMALLAQAADRLSLADKKPAPNSQ